MLSPLSTLAKSQTSGLTFTRAPTVAAGDRITSTQHNLLARAFGDRLKWSVNAWRVAMFDFNLWRQVRNPDSSGFLFPPQSEFYELYQLLENSSGWQWPLTGPDEPEG